MNPNSLKNLTYNHKPLSESFIREEFSKRGYEIIDYTYQNNLTRLNCFDRDGYIVKVSYDSLRQNIKQYKRFSVYCNEDNYLYNINHFIELNKLTCKVIDYKRGKTTSQTHILCECACGNKYWVDFNYWHRTRKDRCNECVGLMSNIELKTMNWLKENEIKFEQQYKFADCKAKRCLPFDFYLTDYNICIEVDGEQHFAQRGMRYFKGGVFTGDNYKKVKMRDDIKTAYCKNKGIKLIRVPYYLFRTKRYKVFLYNEIYNIKD